MNTIFETERLHTSNPWLRTMLCAIASVGLAVLGFNPSQAKAETYVGELTFNAGQMYIHEKCPPSSVLADGSKIDISSNAALYEALGRPHSDNGTTFPVPNALVAFPHSNVVIGYVEPPAEGDIQTYLSTNLPTDEEGKTYWDRMLEAIDDRNFAEAWKQMNYLAKKDASIPTHPTLTYEKRRAEIEADYLAAVKAEEAARLSARKFPCVSLVGKDPMSGDNGQPLQGRVAGEMMLIATSQCPQGWEKLSVVLTEYEQRLLWCKATSGSGVASTMSQYLLYSGNRCPQNTLEADGKPLPISEYSALFSLLGTRYGGTGRYDFGWPSREKIELELLSYYPPAGARFCIVSTGTYPDLR